MTTHLTHLTHRAAVAALAGLVIVLTACAGVDDPDPAATIEAYVAEYNAGDLDGVMDLFAADAVMSRHPLAERAEGRDEIRAVHEREADLEAEYTLVDVETSGGTVTWSHVWAREDDGSTLEFCVDGLVATVEDGLIASWTWPDTGFACDD